MSRLLGHSVVRLPTESFVLSGKIVNGKRDILFFLLIPNKKEEHTAKKDRLSDNTILVLKYTKTTFKKRNSNV